MRFSPFEVAVPARLIGHKKTCEVGNLSMRLNKTWTCYSRRGQVVISMLAIIMCGDGRKAEHDVRAIKFEKGRSDADFEGTDSVRPAG